MRHRSGCKLKTNPKTKALDNQITYFSTSQVDLTSYANSLMPYSNLPDLLNKHSQVFTDVDKYSLITSSSSINIPSYEDFNNNNNDFKVPSTNINIETNNEETQKLVNDSIINGNNQNKIVIFKNNGVIVHKDNIECLTNPQFLNKIKQTLGSNTNDNDLNEKRLENQRTLLKFKKMSKRTLRKIFEKERYLDSTVNNIEEMNLNSTRLLSNSSKSLDDIDSSDSDKEDEDDDDENLKMEPLDDIEIDKNIKKRKHKENDYSKKKENIIIKKEKDDEEEENEINNSTDEENPVEMKEVTQIYMPILSKTYIESFLYEHKKNCFFRPCVKGLNCRINAMYMTKNKGNMILVEGLLPEQKERYIFCTNKLNDIEIAFCPETNLNRFGRITLQQQAEIRKKIEDECNELNITVDQYKTVIKEFNVEQQQCFLCKMYYMAVSHHINEVKNDDITKSTNQVQSFSVFCNSPNEFSGNCTISCPNLGNKEFTGPIPNFEEPYFNLYYDEQHRVHFVKINTYDTQNF
jgi:hypothetical protein